MEGDIHHAEDEMGEVNTLMEVDNSTDASKTTEFKKGEIWLEKDIFGGYHKVKIHRVYEDHIVVREGLFAATKYRDQTRNRAPLVEKIGESWAKRLFRREPVEKETTHE